MALYLFFAHILCAIQRSQMMCETSAAAVTVPSPYSYDKWHCVTNVSLHRQVHTFSTYTPCDVIVIRPSSGAVTSIKPAIVSLSSGWKKDALFLMHDPSTQTLDCTCSYQKSSEMDLLCIMSRIIYIYLMKNDITVWVNISVTVSTLGNETLIS